MGETGWGKWGEGMGRGRGRATGLGLGVGVGGYEANLLRTHPDIGVIVKPGGLKHTALPTKLRLRHL
jgi:hypothetical protein